MKIHVKVLISIFYVPILFLAYSNLAHALAIAPFTPPFSDTFDFYDTSGAAWKTLDASTK